MRHIDEQELGPGESIGSESTLLSQFEVSRATLRQATRLLTFLGAAETRAGPGGGLVSREADTTVLASSMAMVLQHDGARFDSIAAALAVMAPVGASMAARERNDADVVALRIAASALASTSADDTYQAMLSFDATLSAATHDAMFENIWQAVLQIGGVMSISIPPDASAPFADIYHEIVDAIADRDSMAARRAISQHGRDFGKWLIEAHADVLRSPVRWAEVDERLEQWSDST